MKSTSAPKEPSGDGQRDSRGRFVTGNAGGTGNPHAKKVGLLRSALFNTITEKDIREIATSLVSAAKGGDVVAARELLNRVLGRPVEHDLLERIEQLEQMAAARTQK